MRFSNLIRPALLSRFVLMISVLVSSATVTAATISTEEANSVLSALHKAKVEAYLAINAYYSYSMTPGDKAIAAETSEKLQELGGLLKQIDGMTGIKELPTEWTQVRDKWKTFGRLLDTNRRDVAKQGFADLRLVVEMAQANADFIHALEATSTQLKQVSGVQPKPLVEQVRKATLKIEQIMTAYAARSASTVVQAVQGAKTEEPIDVLALQFSEQLDGLTKAASSNADANKLIDSISAQWGFIKSSYLNFNEDTVAYAANLYSRRIIDKLRELETIYAAL